MIRYWTRACPDVLLVKLYQSTLCAFFKGWVTAAAFASFLQPSGLNGGRLCVQIHCIFLTVLVRAEHCRPLHAACKLLQYNSDYTEVVYSHKRRGTGIMAEELLITSNP